MTADDTESVPPVEDVKARSPSSLSFSWSGALAIALPVSSAILAWSQFVVQQKQEELQLQAEAIRSSHESALEQNAHEHAMSLEEKKFHQKWVLDITDRFMNAETVQEKTQLVQILSASLTSSDSVRSAPNSELPNRAMQEEEARLRHLLRELGRQLSEVESPNVHEVAAINTAMERVADSFSAQGEVAENSRGDARASGASSAGSGKPQYLQIGFDGSCASLEKRAETLSREMPAKVREAQDAGRISTEIQADFEFQVHSYRKNGKERCALSAGRYPLTLAVEMRKIWEGVELRDHRFALVTAGSVYEQQVWPKE